LTLLAVSALIVALLPLAANLTFPAPWRLFAAAAAGLALAALAEYRVAMSDSATARALLTDGAERAFHDTYYVVARSHYTLSLALLFAALATGQYLKERASGLRDARLTRILFWLLLGSILLSIHISQMFAQIVMPRRYVDFPGTLRHLSYVTSGAAFVAFSTLAGLVTLLTIVPAARWLKRVR
jgi:heme/copper-type cytochrome/quinol oxidase subunit 1